MEALKCGVCGKDMVSPVGEDLIGCSIVVERRGDESVEQIRYLKQMVAPYSIDKTYICCWGCWLKSLGFKEEDE